MKFANVLYIRWHDYLLTNGLIVHWSVVALRSVLTDNEGKPTLGSLQGGFEPPTYGFSVLKSTPKCYIGKDL